MGLYQMQLQQHKTWEAWKLFLFLFLNNSGSFLWFSGKACVYLYVWEG